MSDPAGISSSPRRHEEHKEDRIPSGASRSPLPRSNADRLAGARRCRRRMGARGNRIDVIPEIRASIPIRSAHEFTRINTNRAVMKSWPRAPASGLGIRGHWCAFVGKKLRWPKSNAGRLPTTIHRSYVESTSLATCPPSGSRIGWSSSGACRYNQIGSSQFGRDAASR
jgi:hypothetical protein